MITKLSTEKTNINSRKFNNLTRWFEDERENLIYCIFVTFLIGLIAHAFAYFNANFSHDALNAAYSTQTEIIWKFELGRFIVPIYQIFFRGRWALPWLIGFLTLMFMSMAVFLITKIFSVKRRVFQLLIAGIMITNITIISQTGTYFHELDCNVLSLMLSILSVYIWKKFADMKGIILSSLCMFISMGLYQSYITVAISLIMFVVIIDLFKNEEIWKTAIHTVKGILSVVCSFVLYNIANKVICSVFNISLQSRTDVFSYAGENSAIEYYWDLIKKAYAHYFEVLIDTNVYGDAIKYIVLSAGVIFGVLLLKILIENKATTFVHKSLAIGIIIILPIAMNAIYVLSRGVVHDVMTYSIWLFFVFLIVLINEFGNDLFKNTTLTSVVRIFTILIVAIVVWQNIIIANTVYLKKDIETKSTLSTMTRIVNELEDVEGYVMNETPVAFIGASSPYGNLEGFRGIISITGVEKNNAISRDTSRYYYNAYKTYFMYVLNYPIKFVDDSTHGVIKQSEEVKEMPCFPAKGSIQMINGTLVVKLG